MWQVVTKNIINIKIGKKIKIKFKKKIKNIANINNLWINFQIIKVILFRNIRKIKSVRFNKCLRKNKFQNFRMLEKEEKVLMAIILLTIIWEIITDKIIKSKVKDTREEIQWMYPDLLLKGKLINLLKGKEKIINQPENTHLISMLKNLQQNSLNCQQSHIPNLLLLILNP